MKKTDLYKDLAALTAWIDNTEASIVYRIRSIADAEKLFEICTMAGIEFLDQVDDFESQTILEEAVGYPLYS